MASFTRDEIDKLGNTFIYLCNNCPNMTKTKALKLLYLIEETSVKFFHVPFLGLDYEVWQYGPVQKDIYYDINEGASLLRDYIRISCEHDGNSVLAAKKEFNDDEFSDFDIEAINFVVKKFGKKSASKLVKLVHQEGSLWHNIAKEKNLIKYFESGLIKTSDFKIDFTKNLSDCEKSRYQDSLEFKQMSNAIKL